MGPTKGHVGIGQRPAFERCPRNEARREAPRAERDQLARPRPCQPPHVARFAFGQDRRAFPARHFEDQESRRAQGNRHVATRIEDRGTHRLRPYRGDLRSPRPGGGRRARRVALGRGLRETPLRFDRRAKRLRHPAGARSGRCRRDIHRRRQNPVRRRGPQRRLAKHDVDLGPERADGRMPLSWLGRCRPRRWTASRRSTSSGRVASSRGSPPRDAGEARPRAVQQARDDDERVLPVAVRETPSLPVSIS